MRSLSGSVPLNVSEFVFVVCIYRVCFVFGLCGDWFYGFVLRKCIHARREF